MARAASVTQIPAETMAELVTAYRTANGAALVARVGPGEPGIRQTLAVEDAEYRSQNRGLFFERMFSRDQEALTYRDMTLNAGAEFERMRAQGVRIPPAPPTMLGQ